MSALRHVASGIVLAAAGALAVAQEDGAQEGSGLRGGTTRAEVYERRAKSRRRPKKLVLIL